MRPASVPEPQMRSTVAPELMDLIVSTPQGEAEISVNAVHESVTIGDLLERVLNSAPPSLVYIDGRPTADRHADERRRTRHRVAHRDRRHRSSGPARAEITLVQAAGEGGGNRRPL